MERKAAEMKTKYMWMSVVAVGVMAVVLSGGSSLAQQGAGPAVARVAIANPARIFNDMAETKDLKLKIEAERKVLEDTERQKRSELQAIQDALRLLKPESTQYADKNRELTQKAVEFEVWGKMTQLEIQRGQRTQMKSLFDKIQAATAQVAAAKGYDLVLADQRPELPENLDQLTVDQVRTLINQRNILYATPAVDISADVTALLDAQYKK